jgi:hypothetical protein
MQNINLPNINLPNINLPNINSPNDTTPKVNSPNNDHKEFYSSVGIAYSPPNFNSSTHHISSPQIANTPIIPIK